MKIVVEVDGVRHVRVKDQGADSFHYCVHHCSLRNICTPGALMCDMGGSLNYHFELEEKSE